MPYLNCPKCRLTTYSDAKSLFNGECPRCSGELSEQPARFFAVDFPTRPRGASGKRATSDSLQAPRGAALGRAGCEAEPVDETYVATSDAATKARHTASGWATANGAGLDTVGRIALAVTEAVANVSMHAYRADPKPGLVAIDLDGNRGEVLSITVSDEGSGIAPRSDSPGLGLGLSLIGRLADVLTLRSPPAGGTELCMQFRITDDGPLLRDRLTVEGEDPGEAFGSSSTRGASSAVDSRGVSGRAVVVEQLVLDHWQSSASLDGEESREQARASAA